jgi:acetyl esterase/lipase
VRRVFASALTLIAMAASLHAQPGPPIFKVTPIDAPAEPEAIALWPDAPASSAEVWNDLTGQRIVRNVARPVLLPVLPAAALANGRTVLVIPGGGYKFVSIDNEGLLVARRLAAAGYTAYVLKYRVQPTPPDAKAFEAALNAEVREMIAKPPESRARREVWPDAIADARQALRWLRERAVSKRISVIGFSAGAHSGRALIEQPDAGTLPDSLALIYGSTHALAAQAATTLPPLFVALADDDPLFGRDGFGLVESWRRAGQRVELHLYERGSHGFGLVPRGTTSDGWIDAYLAWLAKQ